MQPTLFLKVKDPLEFKLVFYCSSCLPLSVLFGENQAAASFSPEQTSWSVPKPSYATICWVFPQALVSSGDSFRHNRANLAVLQPEKKIPAPYPATSLFPSFLP